MLSGTEVTVELDLRKLLASETAIHALYCHAPDLETDDDAGPNEDEEAALRDALLAVAEALQPQAPYQEGPGHTRDDVERLEEIAQSIEKTPRRYYYRAGDTFGDAAFLRDLAKRLLSEEDGAVPGDGEGSGVEELRELAEDDRFVTSLQAHLDGDGVEPMRGDVLETQRTLETFFRFAEESGALTQPAVSEVPGEADLRLTLQEAVAFTIRRCRAIEDDDRGLAAEKAASSERDEARGRVTVAQHLRELLEEPTREVPGNSGGVDEVAKLAEIRATCERWIAGSEGWGKPDESRIGAFRAVIELVDSLQSQPPSPPVDAEPAPTEQPAQEGEDDWPAEAVEYLAEQIYRACVESQGEAPAHWSRVIEGMREFHRQHARRFLKSLSRYVPAPPQGGEGEDRCELTVADAATLTKLLPWPHMLSDGERLLVQRIFDFGEAAS